MAPSAALGEDITSEEVSLEGLAEELELYSSHEVVASVLECGGAAGGDAGAKVRELEAALAGAELRSIESYSAEGDNLVGLLAQIQGCDSVLAGMEDALGGFQSSLGAISSEIRSLQEQSISLSVKLRNRRAAEAKLGELVEEIALPPELIDAILDAEVDEVYVDGLHTLARKLDFVRGGGGAAGAAERLRGAAAMADVAPELERLRRGAVARVREFLLSKFAQLRRPKTNIQILQQSVLLKFKYFGTFLRKYGPEVYDEVVSFYVTTISGVLAGHFKTYVSALANLRGDRVAKGELLGETEREARRHAPGGGGGGSAAGFLKKVGGALGGASSAQLVGGHGGTASAFALGDRATMLRDVESQAVIPHVAESAGQRVLHEEAYRSTHKLLMDTTTSEYLFCHDFFGDPTVFGRLFVAPLAAVEEGLTDVLPLLHDPVGLLMMIRLTYEQQLVMSRRRIPCLDAYFDKATMSIYPKFTAAFDVQAGSLAQAADRAAALAEGGRGRQGAVVPQHAHFVVRRYAAFLASMAALSAGYADSSLDARCGRLRVVGDRFIDRLAHAGGAPPRVQAACALANYDEVLRQLAAALRSPPNPLAAQEPEVQPGSGAAGMRSMGPRALLSHYEERVAAAQAAYVDAELTHELGGLLNFVRAAEGALASGSPVDATKCGQALNDFSSRWRRSIGAMQKAATVAFPDAERAADALKACLAQMLLYYTRALDAAKKGGAEVGSDAPTLPLIMHEIKQVAPDAAK